MGGLYKLKWVPVFFKVKGVLYKLKWVPFLFKVKGGLYKLKWVPVAVFKYREGSISLGWSLLFLSKGRVV